MWYDLVLFCISIHLRFRSWQTLKYWITGKLVANSWLLIENSSSTTSPWCQTTAMKSKRLSKTTTNTSQPYTLIRYQPILSFAIIGLIFSNQSARGGRTGKGANLSEITITVAAATTIMSIMATKGGRGALTRCNYIASCYVAVSCIICHTAQNGG